MHPSSHLISPSAPRTRNPENTCSNPRTWPTHSVRLMYSGGGSRGSCGGPPGGGGAPGPGPSAGPPRGGPPPCIGPLASAAAAAGPAGGPAAGGPVAASTERLGGPGRKPLRRSLAPRSACTAAADPASLAKDSSSPWCRPPTRSSSSGAGTPAEPWEGHRAGVRRPVSTGQHPLSRPTAPTACAQQQRAAACQHIHCQHLHRRTHFPCTFPCRPHSHAPSHTSPTAQHPCQAYLSTFNLSITCSSIHFITCVLAAPHHLPLVRHAGHPRHPGMRAGLGHSGRRRRERVGLRAAAVGWLTAGLCPRNIRNKQENQNK